MGDPINWGGSAPPRARSAKTDRVISWFHPSTHPELGTHSTLKHRVLLEPKWLRIWYKDRHIVGSSLGDRWVIAGSSLGHNWVIIRPSPMGGSSLSHRWVIVGSSLGHSWRMYVYIVYMYV